MFLNEFSELKLYFLSRAKKAVSIIRGILGVTLEMFVLGLSFLTCLGNDDTDTVQIPGETVHFVLP